MANSLSSVHLILIPIICLLAFYYDPLNQALLELDLEYGPRVLHRFHPQPTVTTAQNITYRGSYTSRSDVEHFQNIFYAEEPTGGRRFAPPVPVNLPAGSIIDATQPGAWCPQATGDVLPFTSPVVNVSENCLSLRVARHRKSNNRQDSKLPVAPANKRLGGHALGSASDILYTPDGLVTQAMADGQPLIFVGINYRLGFFGFATGKAFIEAKYTNAGLRDHLAALEWVRDNIEAFGGDPTRVTVIGQSVGASDIGLHLTGFGGEKGVPFQQAVMMSGGPGTNFNTNSDLVARNTADIARQAGCAVDGDDQSMETLKCLQAADASVLTNLSVFASRNARPPFGEGLFYPTLDGDFIRNRPSQLMRDGRFARGVPVIASWVTNDGAWYASPSTSTDEEVMGSFGRWLYGLSETTKKQLLELYPLEDFNHMAPLQADGSTSPVSTQYYRAAQMNRDIWFTCPVLDFAWQYVKNGGADPSQVWLYEANTTRFSAAYEMMGVPMWRVAHLSDIPYVLNVPSLPGSTDNSPPQLELGKRMSRAIARFAGTGSPRIAASGRETWPNAFPHGTEGAVDGEFPSSIALKVFGGLYGTAPVTVARGESPSTAAEQAVHWEKLFSRCEFINSEQMRREAGV